MRIVWICYRAGSSGFDRGDSERVVPLPCAVSWKRAVARFSCTQIGNAVVRDLSSCSLGSRKIRAGGIGGSASPISSVAPRGRCYRQRCIRRQRRPGGRDRQRALLYLRIRCTEGWVIGSGRFGEAPHPQSARPNQRLHLTPRLGHRGRDRVCYRFLLLAISHSFRGAGEPRPLGTRERQHDYTNSVLDASAWRGDGVWLSTAVSSAIRRQLGSKGQSRGSKQLRICSHLRVTRYNLFA
jgi:hypothetical protein